MDLRFSRSAFRHGISRERAAYVVQHCGLPFDGEGEDGGLVLFLGDDWRGVPLEVGAVEREGILVVIHAMRLRTKFREMYVTALPWRQ